MEHWNMLHSEVVEFPSLLMFKTQMDTVMNNLQ